MSNLKSASSNLLTCKVSSKNKKNLNLETKIPYLGIFGLQFNKNYYQTFNQHTRICETIKFYPKQTKKFGNKNTLFGFLARMLKNFGHISNKRPPNCVIAKFCAKCRILKFGTKKCLILVSWEAILKNHCHIWNQHPRIWVSAKFCIETKTPKFAIKNALFGYFWARNFKHYCHIWNQHLWICLIVTFCVETKMPKFGTKNALFGCFRARI